MDKKALIEYIKKEVERGFTKSDITKALADVGYSEDIIESCFEEIAKDTNMYDLLFKEVKDSSVRRYFVFVVIVMAIIGIGVYSLVFIDYNIDNGPREFVDNIAKDIEDPKSSDYKPITPSIKDRITNNVIRKTDVSDKYTFREPDEEVDEGVDVFITKISQEKVDCDFGKEDSVKLCNAIVLEDVESCKNVRMENDRKECEDLVNLKKALINNDACKESQVLPSSMCESVIATEDCSIYSEANLKESCEQLVLLKNGINSRNSMICDDLTLVDNTICYALIGDDASVCNKILSREC